MTIVTPSGLIGADNQIDNVSDLSTWTVFGAQTATSFGIEAALENRIVFGGTGFGAYSGNMPTTGTITSLVITNLDSGTVERETWTGFSFAVSDFLTWINTNNFTALQSAIFGANDTLTATDFADTLFGYVGPDTFVATGGQAGDLFNGGLGTDRLRARGSDANFEDASFVSIERLWLTTDTGSETFLFTTFQGSQIGAGLSLSLEVTGSTLQDIVWVNDVAGALDLSGWTFVGWNPNQATGGDTIQIFANGGANTLTGTSQRDIMRGGGGADTLMGGDGDDRLAASDGNTGDSAADHLHGGDGGDFYEIYEAADVVHENLNQGDDFVQVWFNNYVMAANTEVLGMEGAAVTATGNNLNNNMRGNAFGNVINGMSGDDTLNGNSGADTLRGGAGADSLNGDADIDTASYSSSAARVRVNLATNSGLDADAQGDTFDSIENLIGSAFNDVLTGNTAANAVSGGAGADTLNGNGGGDTLFGGLGLDTLTGGGGNDKFVFDTAPAAANRDAITDYNVAADTMQLDNAVFAGLGPLGALAAGKFRIGAAALDATDRIIYQAASGRLYFDADGSGAIAPIQIATLDAGLALTAADFVVI